MENKSHAMAAGAFVLLVSALLVAMALWLTRDASVQRMYELSTREAVTGLQAQAGVRFRGVSVGKVVSIGFDPLNQGNVLIRISTNDTAPITRSTFGTLGFQGVTGLAFIQLDDSGESKELLPTSEEAVARIPMRPGLLAKLTEQGTALVTQVEEASRKLNLLLAQDNQKLLFAAVQNIGQAASGIGDAATSLQRFSVNADRVLDAQFGPETMNLPKLVQEMTVTMKSLQGTGDKVGASVERLGVSADEVKLMATEVQSLAKTINQPGGVLEKLGEGVQSLSVAGQALNSTTLPRLNRATDEAARVARQVGRTANAVSDNPQSLIYGNGLAAPGPGEAGFVAPAVKP